MKTLVALTIACAFALWGCATAPTTQPSTQASIPAPTLLQILQTAYADAQPFIQAAEISGLISGTALTDVNSVNGAASDALIVASGSPGSQAALDDAAAKIAALVKHPAVVAAKAAAKTTVPAK
jgi:hypothetical protein